MNRVELTGRPTKDIELRFSENNKAISKFSLAVNRNFKNQDGIYEADFINCVAFGKLAETLNEFVKKGDLIGVCGKIQTSNYKDKEGNKKYITEIIVEDMDFLQTKPKENAKDESYKANEDIELTDEDLPF